MLPSETKERYSTESISRNKLVNTSSYNSNDQHSSTPLKKKEPSNDTKNNQSLVKSKTKLLSNQYGVISVSVSVEEKAYATIKRPRDSASETNPDLRYGDTANLMDRDGFEVVWIVSVEEVEVRTIQGEPKSTPATFSQQVFLDWEVLPPEIDDPGINEGVDIRVYHDILETSTKRMVGATRQVIIHRNASAMCTFMIPFEKNQVSTPTSVGMPIPRLHGTRTFIVSLLERTQLPSSKNLSSPCEQNPCDQNYSNRDTTTVLLTRRLATLPRTSFSHSEPLVNPVAKVVLDYVQEAKPRIDPYSSQAIECNDEQDCDGSAQLRRNGKKGLLNGRHQHHEFVANSNEALVWTIFLVLIIHWLHSNPIVFKGLFRQKKLKDLEQEKELDSTPATHLLDNTTEHDMKKISRIPRGKSELLEMSTSETVHQTKKCGEFSMVSTKQLYAENAPDHISNGMELSNEQHDAAGIGNDTEPNISLVLGDDEVNLELPLAHHGRQKHLFSNLKSLDSEETCDRSVPNGSQSTMNSPTFSTGCGQNCDSPCTKHEDHNTKPLTSFDELNCINPNTSGNDTCDMVPCNDTETMTSKYYNHQRSEKPTENPSNRTESIGTAVSLYNACHTQKKRRERAEITSQASMMGESYVSTLPPDSDYISDDDHSQFGSMRSVNEGRSTYSQQQQQQQQNTAASTNNNGDEQKSFVRKRRRIELGRSCNECNHDDDESVEVVLVTERKSLKRKEGRPYSKSNYVADWVPSNGLQSMSAEFLKEEDWGIVLPDFQPSKPMLSKSITQAPKRKRNFPELVSAPRKRRSVRKKPRKGKR